MGKRHRARQRSGDVANDRAAERAVATLWELVRRPVAKVGDLAPEPVAERLAAALTPADRRTVQRRLDELGASIVETAWAQGWQPVDLTAVVRRHLTGTHARLAARWQTAAAAVLPPERPDPWPSQLATTAALAHDERPSRRPGGEPPPGSVAADAVAWSDAVRALWVLGGLPAIDELGPPPAAWSDPLRMAAARAASAGSAVDADLLRRVRSLLAKAESTTFEAEADAFTAKAQQLMARHAIDDALLHESAADEVPVTRRVWIDNPYADGKSLLLSEVASANRSRSVYFPGVGFSSVMGFPADLDSVDLLFTSLLVQAGRSLSSAGAARQAGARSRSRAFRQSFWVSFASRIGQRLAEAGEAATAERGAELGRDLLPVLASRHQKVEDAFSAAYPNLRQRSLRARDAAGWEAGTIAADGADLTVHREVRSRA